MLPNVRAQAIRATLRAERERRGLSQKDLGKQLGRATYQTVYSWESGANDPTLSNLLDWAAALDYQVTLIPAETDTGGDQPQPAS